MSAYRAEDAEVVDEDVHVRQLTLQLRGTLLRGDVDGDTHHITGDLRNRGLDAIGGASVDRDPCAACSESLGDGGADALGRPGDKCRFSTQIDLHDEVLPPRQQNYSDRAMRSRGPVGRRQWKYIAARRSAVASTVPTTRPIHCGKK